MINELIKKFGGMSALARALGHKHPTTVQGWRDSGVIPHWRRGAVAAAARVNGIELTTSELLYLGGGGVAPVAKSLVEGLALAGGDAAAARILFNDGGWALQLVNHTVDLVCFCQKGRIIFINEHGASRLGFKDSKLLNGQMFVDFVHHDYRDIANKIIANGGDAGRSKQKPLPMKLISSQGAILDCELLFLPVGEAANGSVVIQAHDITEQVGAAETLRQAHVELEQKVAERTRELTKEISERRIAVEKLKMAANVIDNINEAVVIVDADFHVISANPAYSIISGYSANELIGKRPFFHASMMEDSSFYAKLTDSLNRKKSWDGELWCNNKSGEKSAMRLSLTAIADDQGKAYKYVALISDITQRKHDEERIHFQANYDALTELPNRTLFHDRLNQSLPTMLRMNSKLGLMFIDLDGFKLVNDTLGHDMGDLMLKESSKRLLNCIRSGDTVARLGGDEFTVIMPNLADPQNANLLAQRIIDSLAKPFDLDGHEAFVSGSIGITIFPDDATDAIELIKNADAAMYRAKEQGKANCQFFTADLNKNVKERLILKNNLNKALERGEFSLHYQPKLNIQKGGVTSCEALMRWNNDIMGGMISPARFIPIIEETGQVVEVGKWAIFTACRQHNTWLKQGLPPIRIAVNLSARQLREPGFIKIVEDALCETGLDSQYLEIEITESMLMSDSANVVTSLNKLHDMGLQVAMDDFGTGYSSLSYLKRFPIDTIKIDRSFVLDIATSHDDAEIIRTIITMGQTLNRKIVAEGVETVEQLEMLRVYKCDEIQGYYFSRPLAADGMVNFFEEKKIKTIL